MSRSEVPSPEHTTIHRAKQHFLETFRKKDNPIYPYLPRHVNEAEKWAERILVNYPEADREIVMLSVWLHDIGWAVGEEEIDHAIKSEEEAISFLTEIGAPPEMIGKVAHCCRAHRCRDVQPETLEARIVAAADSASHFTDINYIVHCSEGMKDYALGKLERDYRDVSLIPGLQEELAPLYSAWKHLLSVYPD